MKINKKRRSLLVTLIEKPSFSLQFPTPIYMNPGVTVTDLLFSRSRRIQRTESTDL